MYNVETILVTCMSNPFTDSPNPLSLFPTPLQKPEKQTNKKRWLQVSFMVKSLISRTHILSLSLSWNMILVTLIQFECHLVDQKKHIRWNVFQTYDQNMMNNHGGQSFKHDTVPLMAQSLKRGTPEEVFGGRSQL